tara:strand:- start:17 stop:616 length:600 start_codon:yes stop_codon:yes gene_type:complete
MFNGIINNKGKVCKISNRRNGLNLFIKSSIKIYKNQIGISISCDGVCLTLISFNKNVSEFYLSNETLDKSKFRNVKIGDEINLELPLKKGQNISGHICQGHVDTIAKIKEIKKIDKAFLFNFKIDRKFINYLVEKASISINGISLTISKINKCTFDIWIIPHTFKSTNLSILKKNDLVNIEIDILSKYIKNFINGKKKI